MAVQCKAPLLHTSELRNGLLEHHRCLRLLSQDHIHPTSSIQAKEMKADQSLRLQRCPAGLAPLQQILLLLLQMSSDVSRACLEGTHTKKDVQLVLCQKCGDDFPNRNAGNAYALAPWEAVPEVDGWASLGQTTLACASPALVGLRHWCILT
jgi:hypothetical protein